jgi:hypothetical protein
MALSITKVTYTGIRISNVSASQIQIVAPARLEKIKHDTNKLLDLLLRFTLPSSFIMHHATSNWTSTTNDKPETYQNDTTTCTTTLPVTTRSANEETGTAATSQR